MQVPRGFTYSKRPTRCQFLKLHAFPVDNIYPCQA